MTCDFSYNHYRDCLNKALKAGFAITNFQNFSKVKADKVILLRHDVDSQPKRHLKMAEIENSLGIKSTYFIRVHGEYYQPFDKINYPIIKKIKDLGHEIGLHTEARTFGKIYQENPTDIFFKEKAFLEQLFDLRIKTASEHAEINRPDNFWDNHFFKSRELKSLGIKRQPFMREFKKLKYLSDSLGSWREGCICENLSKYDRIQLLVHADVWGKDAIKDLARMDNRYQKYV